MAENDGNQQQQQDDKTPKPMTGEESKALQQSIDTLSGGIKDMLTLANKKAQEQQQNQQVQQTQQTSDDDDDELDDATLEALPRRQFMNHLLKSFESKLTQGLKPLQDSITQARTAAMTIDAKVVAEKFAALPEHVDFPDWKDEMIKLAGENPGLSIPRLYALARFEDPKKAGELDKKYAAERKKAADAAGGDSPPVRRRSAGGGLTPGGTGGDSKPGNMNPQQAAEAAWQETIARFGGNPFEA